MNDDKTPLDDTVGTLKQERDELRVKLQLVKQEIRDQWEPLEQKWQTVESRLRSLGDTPTEAGKDVIAASSLLLEEIAHAYRQIWKELRQ